MDIVSVKTRSKIMASVKQRDTKPEIVVRSLLHNMGFRFRLHRKDLPGSPDIVLPRYRTIIFVNGCFWHGHPGCKRASRPTSNTEFWNTKLSANVERDKRNQEVLLHMGWNVIAVWECETKNIDSLKTRLKMELSTCSKNL